MLTCLGGVEEEGGDIVSPFKFCYYSDLNPWVC